MHKSFDIHGYRFAVYAIGWSHRPDDGRLALTLTENYFRQRVGGRAAEVWQQLRSWDHEGGPFPSEAAAAIADAEAAFRSAYRPGVDPGRVWLGARA